MSSSGTLRGAIVGFGAAARAHLAGYENCRDVEIVAVLDPSIERRAAARAMLASAGVYATLGELAASEPDFLDICCPPRWHGEAIAAGLQMGCHVMCEKPLLPTLDEYREILNVLGRSSGVLFPSHNYKFAPVLRQMREIVMSEAFGQVVSGHFRTLRTSHASGTPDWYPDWRRDAAVAGGGILQDHGTHAAYLAMFLTGLTPQWAACTTSHMGSRAFPGTEHSALLTLGFMGGAELTVELTWAATSRQTSYAISGTRQSVVIDGSQFVHRARHRALRTCRAWDFTAPSHSRWFADMFEDFRALIGDPWRQRFLLAEAHLAAAVVAGAYASAARDGEAVEIPASTDSQSS